MIHLMSLRFLSKTQDLGRAVRWLCLLTLTGWLSSLAPKTKGVLPEWPFFVSGAMVFGLWFALRPVRRVCFLKACQFMIGSGISFLLRFGVWELLTVAVQFWPSSLPDFVGIEALHRTYDSMDPSKQREVVATIREFEKWPGCPVAKNAVMFLEVIDQYK